MEERLTESQLRSLLGVARHAIAQGLGVQAQVGIDWEALKRDKALAAKAGTFVTLTEGGELRGCIGSLEARDSILEGVRRNALNAAFRDPRFPPLGRKEFDRIRIEVSVLTEPKPLHYTDPEDLLRKLRPGVDGVILSRGFASATFLPQVWDQLPDREEFLSHLCMKAGLPGDAWRRERLDVMTYQVQSLEEE
jgi:AmmeMemoRadiSam system protein A